jgi:hypothetical protein
MTKCLSDYQPQDCCQSETMLSSKCAAKVIERANLKELARRGEFEMVFRLTRPTHFAD